MADSNVISHGYGRCIEAWRQCDEAIKRRLRQLHMTGATADDLRDDLELLTLQVDRAAWERLMRETPKFVGGERA